MAKFNSGGTHLWSHGYGDPGAEEVVSDLDVDGLGHVFITGSFWGTMDLGGGPLTSAGTEDIFLAKFHSDGSHIWSKRFGDSNEQDGEGVIADGAGGVFAVGSFYGDVDFGGGVLTSAGGRDIYVAKFRSTPTGISVNSERPRLEIQAYPNPFNPATTITYFIPASGLVNVDVYDVDGRLIRSLVHERKTAGPHIVTWHGRDKNESDVSSGIYFVLLRSGGTSESRKLVLLK